MLLRNIDEIFSDMDERFDDDPSVSTPLLTSTSSTIQEFKVYRRRWLYLVCLCLANMSNAIVRKISQLSVFLYLFFVDNSLKKTSCGSILHRSLIKQKIILMRRTMRSIGYR